MTTSPWCCHRSRLTVAGFSSNTAAMVCREATMACSRRLSSSRSFARRISRSIGVSADLGRRGRKPVTHAQYIAHRACWESATRLIQHRMERCSSLPSGTSFICVSLSFTVCVDLGNKGIRTRSGATRSYCQVSAELLEARKVCLSSHLAVRALSITQRRGKWVRSGVFSGMVESSVA